jgi:DNA-binding MarR family transcriptional regulator
VTKLAHFYNVKKKVKNMADITRDEVQDSGKEKALKIVKGALELAGLNPDEYDLALYKKNRIKAAPNIQLFQTAAYLAATCLSPSANKILMYFLSISEFENYVGMDQKTLHEELNISMRSTERGINELVESGIIIKVKHLSDKRRNDYFINPMQAWKGKIMN